MFFPFPPSKRFLVDAFKLNKLKLASTFSTDDVIILLSNVVDCTCTVSAFALSTYNTLALRHQELQISKELINSNLTFLNCRHHLFE